MSHISKIFSVVLIIPLITTFTAPAASAAPEEPEEPKIGAAVVTIGYYLEERWNGVMETWDKFASAVSELINNLFQSQKFVDVNSEEGKAIVAAIDAIYEASGGSPKKDGKVYVEAKKSEDGKSIEIRTKQMTEDEALKEMGNGKHIMTKNEELSKNIVERYYKDYKITRIIK